MNKKTSNIANLYNTTAKVYNKRYKSIQEEKINKIIKYSVNLKSKLVLDVGCGSGFLKSFLEKNTRYVGLDISHEMLKQNKSEKNLICSDITNLPFLDEIFNEIYCITVLQNVENKGKALDELKRVLKNEGRIFLSVLRKTHNKKELKKLADLELIKTIDNKKIEDILFVFEKNT